MSLPPPQLPPPGLSPETAVHPPIAYSDLLFDSHGEDDIPELGDVDQLLGGVSLALRSAARREVFTAIKGALGATAFDVVETGWQKHGDLVGAARRTLDPPGATETIELATHRIEARYSPRVDVFVDGTRMGSLELALTVDARVAAVIAVITGGTLVALRSGHVDLGARLLVEGHELANGSRRADLATEMPLGEGIRLASP